MRKTQTKENEIQYINKQRIHKNTIGADDKLFK